MVTTTYQEERSSHYSDYKFCEVSKFTSTE